MLDWLFKFPVDLNKRLRWKDLRWHRIEGTRLHRWHFVEGYSTLALWLPMPVIFFFAYGLPGWRGWWLFGLTAAALVIHLVICRHPGGPHFPRRQWLLVAGTAVAACVLGLLVGGRQFDPLPYPHIFGLFGAVVLALAMWVDRRWVEYLIKNDRSWFRSQFAGRLASTQLFVNQPDPPAQRRGVRLLRAYLLVPLSSPLMLAVVPALVVVFVDAGQVVWWGFVALLIWWALLATAHYHDRLTMFRLLVREALLSGGAGAVSIIVIVFAATRLAGIDYVTTVLDQPSRFTITWTIVIFYLVSWLYDYWHDRAAAEAMLGLLDQHAENHPTSIRYRQDADLRIHGAGRLIAIRHDELKGFESYRPLDVFRRIVEQLEGRVRAKEATQPETPKWQDVDAAAGALDVLVQKLRLYDLLPALLIGALIVGGFGYVFSQEQRPALVAETTGGSFDLGAALRDAPAGETYYAVAASGGGTRAALYSYALMRALRDRGVLDRVMVASSVSGGSAGVAYFAAHREELLARQGWEDRWRRYRDALAAEHIERVLAGTGEIRFFLGERLGKLLTESFESHFNPAPCERIGCAGIGVIFNTSVAGAWRSGQHQSGACLKKCRKWHKCGTIDRAGSRLVITNLTSVDPDSVATRTAGWPLDLQYEVVRDPSAPLTAAAALSANFPPVFSNAAVHLDADTDAERRYWVTDGGAMDNRGLISLLLALLAEARQWQGDQAPPSLKILIAEASGMSVAYKEDRGFGALGAAKERIADKLIAELAGALQTAWSRLGGGGASVELVYLPMPQALRTGFGTHWQLPAEITLRDPQKWYLHDKWAKRDSMNTRQLLWMADNLFSEDPSSDPDNTAQTQAWQWIEPDAAENRRLLDQAVR